MGDYVIATEFPTAEQKADGSEGTPIAWRFGETVIALLKLAKPVRGGNENWVLASGPSIEGPFEFLEETYGARMNRPLIALGKIAETAINSVAPVKKTTAKPVAAAEPAKAAKAAPKPKASVKAVKVA